MSPGKTKKLHHAAAFADKALHSYEGKPVEDMPQDELHYAIHELRNNQFELEMQNEQLRTIQEELRQTRDKYSGLYNHAPVGYLTLSQDHKILELNQALLVLLGREREELLQQNFQHYILPEDQDIYDKFSRQLLKTHASQSTELRLRGQDGGVFWVKLDGGPVESTERNYVRFNLVLSDITERKQFEERLVEAKEMWENTFDAISDSVAILDEQMRIVRVNKAASRTFNLPAAEMVGRYCYEAFCGKSGACGECPVVHTIRDHKSYSAEMENTRLGRTFYLSSSPLWNKDGNFSGVVYLAKDVTVQTKLESQLRQSQKMEAIGTLAGGIAHDFNNILQSLLGYSSLVLEKLPKGSQIREYQESVLEAANRAKNLVKQILTFSRKAEIQKQPFQIQMIIKETLKFIRSSIPANIEIVQNIGGGEGYVFADPTQIHQVLMNICTNAYTAMYEQGGRLTVVTEEVALEQESMRTIGLEPGRYLRLSISDTGPGIDKSIQARIFEPYFTTKKKGEGSGMGLAVAHSIVSRHGGQLLVESELGKGATFHVYLPCIDQRSTTLDLGRKEVLPRGDERLLVVDDDLEIVRLEQEILERLGYKVTAFADSHQALESFRETPADYDLVITDMTMPGITGSELSQKIMAIRPEIPVIVCTGFSRVFDEARAAGIGVKDYVVKPFTREKLATTVRKALDEA